MIDTTSACCGLLPLFACFAAHAQSPTEVGRVDVRVDALRNDATWTAEASRLVCVGAPSVPSLRATLRAAADEPVLAVRTLAVLARLGPEAQSAGPELYACLKDEDAAVVVAGYRAMRTVAPTTTPSLHIAFNHTLGPEGPRWSKAEREQVRVAGLPALISVDHHYRSERTPDARILVRLVGQGQPSFSVAACDALIAGGLDDEAVRRDFFAAMGEHLKRRVPVALRATRASAQTPDDVCLARYAVVLAQHDPKSEGATLARGYLMLRDVFPELRDRWARELVVEGPRARAALPALQEQLEWGRDNVPRCRLAVQCALAIGPDAAALLPAIERLADVEDAALRKLLGEARRRLGDGAPGAKQPGSAATNRR